MSADTPLVIADHAGFMIGTKALVHGVSFTLEPGSVTALVGPNGAGKSTMLSLLAGDLAPSTGRVLLAGTAATDWPPGRLALMRAVMMQHHKVQFAYTVEEIVAMARLPHPVRPDHDATIIRRSLNLADIVALSGREVTTLSGGELARTVFARVLAQETPLLLLDEPTAALDLRHTELVMRALRDRAAGGDCVVTVVHDLNLAARYADRILMFGDGALVADGRPTEVLSAERIEEVYGQQVAVLPHPESDVPLVVPIG